MAKKYHLLLQVALIMAVVAIGASCHYAQPQSPELIDFGQPPLTPIGEPLDVSEVPRESIIRTPAKRVFGPVVTPTPTPTPTPIPPVPEPKIELMLRDWQMSYITPNGAVVIEDKRAKQEIKLKLGQTKTVHRGRNQTLTVTLTKLDNRKFIATFGAPAWKNETELKQVFELKLF